jgi:hypothetical protein
MITQLNGLPADLPDLPLDAGKVAVLAEKATTTGKACFQGHVRRCVVFMCIHARFRLRNTSPVAKRHLDRQSQAGSLHRAGCQRSRWAPLDPLRVIGQAMCYKGAIRGCIAELAAHETMQTSATTKTSARTRCTRSQF